MSSEPRPPIPITADTKAGRLESWKEIAAYLGRSERTVHRWEKTEGLPVHRLFHDQRGSVFAHRSELDLWREGRKAALGPPGESTRLLVVRGTAWRVASAGVVALLALLLVLLIPRIRERGDRLSLAVLPLQNLSGDPNQQYFADGVTEAITTELGRIESLRVTSRTSAMQPQLSGQDLRQIARELHARYVIEGSVGRFGTRVRVTAQLIDADSDRHIWANSYDRDLDDILALQGEIAQSVAREVRARLSPEVQHQLTRRDRVRPEAYEAYLRGRYLQSQGTHESLDRSIRYFEDAIAAQPDYAAAFAGLADSQAQLSTAYLPPRDAMPRAKVAAQAALALDDSIAEAHVSIGRVALLYDWDWTAAEKHFRRALELNPSAASAHDWYATYLARMSRFPESIAAMQRAHELDPVSLSSTFLEGWNFLYAKQYDQLIEENQRALNLDPRFAWAHTFLGWALARGGKAAEGLSHAETGARNDDSPVPEGMLGEVQAMANNSTSAERLLADLKLRAGRQYVCPHEIAALQAALHHYDQALDSLEQAYQVRSECMAFLAVDPRMDALRSEPRFKLLLQRVVP
jgi:TolB-like protein